MTHILLHGPDLLPVRHIGNKMAERHEEHPPGQPAVIAYGALPGDVHELQEGGIARDREEEQVDQDVSRPAEELRNVVPLPLPPVRERLEFRRQGRAELEEG